MAHDLPIGLVDTEGRLLAGSPVPAGALALPVHLHDAIVGHVEYDAAVPRDVVALVCTSLELAIRGARHHASEERAANELAIGRDIQRSLLPRHFPEVEGWRFAADYEPAREVGGDLYDVFRIRGDREDVALLIADVTGKGVPAALLMADTKALLHAAADNADDPADALGRVNRILAVERRSSLFVTAALAAIDTDTATCGWPVRATSRRSSSGPTGAWTPSWRAARSWVPSPARRTSRPPLASGRATSSCSTPTGSPTRATPPGSSTARLACVACSPA